jgi:hypothetical protein
MLSDVHFREPSFKTDTPWRQYRLHGIMRGVDGNGTHCETMLNVSRVRSFSPFLFSDAIPKLPEPDARKAIAAGELMTNDYGGVRMKFPALSRAVEDYDGDGFTDFVYTTNVRNDDAATSYIFALTLSGRNLSVIKPPSYFTPPTDQDAHPGGASGPEDTRLFRHDGKLWALSVLYEGEQEGGQRRQFVHNWDQSAEGEQSVALKCPTCAPPLRDVEKNWAAVSSSHPAMAKRMHFVYSFAPLRIMQCDYRTGDCEMTFDEAVAEAGGAGGASGAGGAPQDFQEASNYLRGGSQFEEYASVPHLRCAASTNALTPDTDTGSRTRTTWAPATPPCTSTRARVSPPPERRA